MVHPNEILDGAIVRGFMGRHATTYAIQNHPVVRALYAQHAHTLWFGGVVLTVAQATEPERVRSACLAAGLVAHVLGADGALFTKIGGGAPHVDMAQAAVRTTFDRGAITPRCGYTASRKHTASGCTCIGEHFRSSPIIAQADDARRRPKPVGSVWQRKSRASCSRHRPWKAHSQPRASPP